jgi:hypothetical protein
MRLIMTNREKDENRDLWLKARAGDETTGPCIGGSIIGDILALDGAPGRPYKAWMTLTGRLGADDEPTRQMRFGNFCEPFSRQLLAEKFWDTHFTDGGLYCHDTMPWWRCTFDLLAHPSASCPGTPGGRSRELYAVPDCTAPAAVTVQQKNTLFDDWGQAGIPAHHRVQALWEAGVLLGGRKPGEDGAPTSAWLVPFDRNNVVVDIFELPLDDQALRDIDIMVEAAEHMRDLVRRDVPPPVDGHPSTSEALRRRWNTVDTGRVVVVPWQTALRWRRAGQASTAAKRRGRLYGNRILAAARDAETVMSRDPATGILVKVATRHVGSRAAYSVEAADQIVTLRPNQGWKP